MPQFDVDLAKVRLFAAWSPRVPAFLALITFAGHGAARGQSAADLRAAGETELPSVRLVDVRHVDSRVDLMGIRVGYVETDETPGHYFCGALDADRGASAAQPVADALALLPYVSVRNLGLRYVILCGGEKSGDRPIGGIPVPELDLLMLNAGASGNAAYNAAYLEHATLHELYHMVESRFHTMDDGDWDQQFNGYSNSYAPDLLKGALGTGGPGFLNAYAETFPYEDRAELFATLLLKPGDVLAQIGATSDSVLRRKVLYMDQKSQRLLGLKLAPEGL